MKTRFGCIASMVLIAGLACSVPAWAEEETRGEFEGSVEVLYRNVSQDGSSRKYDEDFDGLGSGTSLDKLSASWTQLDAALADYVRLEASGLGEDPYQRTWFRMGREDKYDLRVNYTKQDYIYNLFELVPDEDGARWDAERQQTSIGLTVYPNDKVKLFFDFQEGHRSGDSLFMKDINRQLFRMETPLDVVTRRYSVGAAFEVGPVDIVVRQALRRYSNDFVNTTEDDNGLEAGSLASLSSYEWDQKDSGGTDWTTLKVSAPIGNRVNVTFSVMGTFAGEEEIESSVAVNAEGTSFSGTCSVSGGGCSSNAQCPGVGDICVANPYSVTDGFNSTEVEGDTTLLELDVGVRLTRELDLHVQYRSLDRDLDGESLRDLEGTGTPSAVDTTQDYEINTTTALLEYRPTRKVGLRGGIRTIDRELNRTGFVGLRNVDYDSGDDETLILGLTLKPTDWLRLNADYEDGDVDQPFNAVAAEEREHTRVRAVITPQKDMRIDLAYLDYDNTNSALDIRDLTAPQSSWDGSSEGTTWSGTFWHKASPRVDYMLRYAKQEIDTSVGITFDTAGFGAVEDGDSIFDNDNTQYSGQVNFSWADPWKAYVRYWYAESDGDNLLLGDTSGLVNDQPIDQEFANAEVGMTYSFSTGMFIGGSYRDYDYDDDNDLLDYDGAIFSFRIGTRF